MAVYGKTPDPVWSLKMSEIHDLGNGIKVLRVPSGWIYSFPDGSKVFVPFPPKDNDSQKQQPAAQGTAVNPKVPF